MTVAEISPSSRQKNTKTMPTSDLFPPGKVSVTGELSDRLHLNFDRLEKEEYRPKTESAEALATFYRGHPANWSWPGDFIGRLILALSHLTRVTKRNPQYLNQILQNLPAHLNSKGYLGEISADIDEQQISGHGWLVSGLIQHWKLTGDKTSYDLAVKITEELHLPLRNQMSSYPGKLDQRVLTGEQAGTIVNQVGNWKLSSDIGCVFIGLEGIVRVAIETGREDLKALVDEMFAVFASIDVIDISAQLHASLTAARMFLLYHEAEGRPEMLRVARRIYELFRTEAITENYANYNWFRRPTWTEPCAIVDALLLSLALYRHTGEPEYLNDAHHIYFNAIGYAQKPHGGFGCDTCVGSEATFIAPAPVGFDVIWCCNMRGSVGLSELVENIYLRQGPDLTVAWYFNSKAELDFPEGKMVVSQTTLYPETGDVLFRVEESTLPGEREIRFFIPPWVEGDKIVLELNGKKTPVAGKQGWVGIRHAWKKGDEIHLAFPITLRTQPSINPHSMPGHYSYRHGTLILGTHISLATHTRHGLQMTKPACYRAAGSDGIKLNPLTDIYKLPEAAAFHDQKKILFR
jgi:hypothetical protein